MNYLTTAQYLKKNWGVALFFALWALGSVWYYFAIVSKIEPPTEPQKPFVDKNCSDFKTQREAQIFFTGAGGLQSGDPHKLDANKNGLACESLP